MKHAFPILVLIFVLLTASYVFAQKSQGTTIRAEANSAKECAICHYEMMDVFVTKNTGTDIALLPVGKEVSTERMCFSCHDGSVGDSRLRVWDHQAAAHKTSVTLKENMRPPTTLPLVNGQITCMTCHSAHGTGTGKEQRMSISTSLFMRLDNDKSQLCQACHTDKSGTRDHSLKELDAKYSGAVTSLGGKISPDKKVICESCHSVHGAKSEKLTLETTSDMSLCKVCHQDMFIDPATKAKAMMPHVSDGKSLSEDVAKVLKDNNRPMSKSGELVCYSCHVVHGAKGESILFSEKKGEQFCGQCHQGFDKIMGSSHDLGKVKGYKNIDGKTIAETGTCGACHGGHKWRTVFKGEKVDMVTQICVNCHKTGGAAEKRLIDISMFNHYISDLDPNDFPAKDRLKTRDLAKLANEFLKTYTTKTQALRILMKDKEMSCITCHDIHNGNKLFMRQEIDNGKICLNCHIDQESVIKTPHGKDKLSDCTACHQLHNSKTSLLVRNIEDMNNGCLNCHEKKTGKAAKDLPKGMITQMPKELLVDANHSHPTGIDNATAFPAPMRAQKSGKFSCVSCHDAHVSDQKSVMKGNFIRLDKSIKAPEDFCITCHNEQKPIIMTSHATDKDKLPIANTRTGRLSGSCDRCHKTHNAFAKKGIPRIEQAYTSPDDLCINCHKEGGDAKDHPVDITKGHKTGLVEKVKDGIETKLLTKEDKAMFLRCVTCHEPHADTSKISVEGKKADTFMKDLGQKNDMICTVCHITPVSVTDGPHNVNKFEKKTDEIKTLIINNDQCGACHTMHNSNPKFLMVGANTEARCMNCHDSDKSSKKHVELSHKSKPDFKNKKTGDLPLEDNNTITCGTCHETHKATPMLIRSASGKGEDLCIVCHEEQKDVIMSKHNMDINNGSDDEIKKLAAISTCGPCHAAHVERPASMMLGMENIKTKISADGDVNMKFMIESRCIACHSKKGTASAYSPEFLRHPAVLKTLSKYALFGEYVYDGRGALSAVGDIDCATCHNPHEWSIDKQKLYEFNMAGQKIDGDNSTSFLKKSVSKEFCGICHEDAQKNFEKFHTKELRESFNKSSQPEPLLKRLFKLF